MIDSGYFMLGYFLTGPAALSLMGYTVSALQERLDARAMEHAAERAKLAESEIIRMEVRYLLFVTPLRPR